MSSEISEDKFYVCDRCTACCRWPGDVKIEEDEVEAIADYLGMSSNDFIMKYTRLRTNRNGLSLVEKENHECIMLKGRDCVINDVKPRQCSGFPNTWNFPGWQKVCHAKPIPMDEAKEKGLI